MATITRTITAAHYIGAEKYKRSDKLTFDPDTPLNWETARAHLRVTYPHGFVVCIHPAEIGPRGGWGRARYYKEGQAFLHRHRRANFYIATCQMLDIFSQ